MSKRPITYVSQFNFTLDARGRVFVPSEWRVEGDEENYYLVWANVEEGCLTFLTREMQDVIYAKIANTTQASAEDQQFLRDFFGCTKHVGVDKQGRILLPREYCESVGIKKDVVFVGLGRNFQIWAADRLPKPKINMREAMGRLGI